ncbi:MAG: CBS domain-containing protein [Acidobacteriota bacterium]|nr:CBS domain-containing protein [Acidobacteriota bacterium]
MPAPVGRGDVQALSAAGAVLLDVLDPEEFSQAHLPGARNLALGHLAVDRLADLSRGEPLVVYGAGSECDRSARAARLLEHYGFEEVYDYEAGKSDWLAFGLPFEGDGTVLAVHLLEPCLCVADDETVATLRARLDDQVVPSAVVVDSAGIVLGLVGRGALTGAAPDVPARHVAQLDPVTVRPSAPADELAALLEDAGTPAALVTTSSGRLLGQVTGARLRAGTPAAASAGRRTRPPEALAATG